MADGSDGEEEAPAEAKPKTSFLSVGDAESVQLVFTQADADEGQGRGRATVAAVAVAAGRQRRACSAR